MEDHGDFVRNIMNGNEDEIKRNCPVISLKSNDFNDVIMFAIMKSKEVSDMEAYNMAINLANEKRII